MAQSVPRKKTKATGASGGRRTVVYRDAKGRTFLAKVTGAGTGQTLNLQIVDRDRKTKGNQTLSNVPLATTMKSTGAFFNIAS